MQKHIIYLAAGNSRRFGQNKLLTEFCGKPLYRHGLDMLLGVARDRSDCTLLVVSQYDEILRYAAQHGANAVFSPDSTAGMSYTIRTAIRAAAPAEEDYLLFVVSDQPYLTAQTVVRMLDAADSRPLTATAVWGERVGNPTLFSASLVPELLALKDDEGGRRVIRRHEAECLHVPVTDERELWDIDTPDALKG